MSVIKKFLCYIVLLILISGCVNIKSKYIPPKIYTIQQQPINNSIQTKIDKSIFVKQFNVGAEFETNKIVVFNGNNLHYYNYHLWALPFDELLTNYVINRFNIYNTFTRGVFSSIFSATPNYILECKINTFKISNSENSIEVVLTMYLYKYSSENKDYQMFFSNNYSKKENVINFSLDEVSIILENIMSEITDNILKDIIGI